MLPKALWQLGMAVSCANFFFSGVLFSLASFSS